MSVTIPLERAQQRGLRRVADPTEAAAALDRLQTEAGMELVAGLTWDKQLKRLRERFGCGDLDGIVDVLATLVDADARRPLNHSQRMLRDKAEEAFVTEIAASLRARRGRLAGQGAGSARRAPRRARVEPPPRRLRQPALDLDPS